MRSLIPSPLKLARLALLIITLAALLHVSLWYARLLHVSHSPSSRKGSAGAVGRILERLKAAQTQHAAGGATAHAGAIGAARHDGSGRWGRWGGRGGQVSLDQGNGEKHKVLANGMLETNPAAPHPIYQLVRDAQARWEKKLAKASRSLPEAVGEYRRRYGRDPPAGFEAWWAYVKQKNVQLPDEYDQITRDLEPFWALRASRLRALASKAGEREGFFTLACRRGRCTAEIFNEEELDGEVRRVAQERAQAQLDLLKPVEKYIPDVEVPMYAHDTPWQFVGHDMRSNMIDSASLGEYYDESSEIDKQHVGWASACPLTRPLRSYDRASYKTPDHIFVSSHALSMDPCQNPSLVDTQGFLLGYGRGPGPASTIYPALSLCKTSLHADVLGVVHEGWTEDIGPDPEWEEKDGKVLWRGSNTGVFAKKNYGQMEDGAWTRSQRMTLVAMTQRSDGTRSVLTPSSPGKAVGPAEEQSYAELNRVIDVGFTAPAVQCSPELCAKIEREYAFKPRVDRPEHNRAKYLLDVDGNGWSARFKRLMSSRSAVLKATIFPEWYADRVQEWVHYIPLRADMEDLYDVTQFFLGGSADDEQGRQQRDAMGKEIGEAGREWSLNFWRHEDMVAYQFRLVLELARLMSDDRAGASYTPPMSDGDIF